MGWEEYAKLTRVLLDFYGLSETDRERVMLMMDGLKYRSANER